MSSGQGRESEGPWFRTIKATARARTRLVCFPRVGGTPSFFLPWGALVPEDVEVLAVCYPGREHRLLEPPVATMAELADDIADTCVRLPSLPTIFFGHGFGGAIGYEVAQRVQDRPGMTLMALAVSGCAGPGRETPTDLGGSGDAEIIAGITSLGGADARIFGSPELLELILPAIRGDYRLAEAYVGQRGAADVPVRLSVPVVAYYGDREDELDEDAVGAWSAVTTGAFRVRAFGGDHFFLVRHGPALLNDLFAGLVRV